MNTSVRRVKSKKELDAAIEDAQVEGWKLKSRGETNAVMKKGGSYGGAMGHALIAVFTVWFTLGIGNLLYAGYRYYTESQELQLKIVKK